MIRWTTIIGFLGLTMILVLPACGDDDDDLSAETENPEDDDDDTTENDNKPEDPTNDAKVFAINPIATPDPVDVVLPWVADDAKGFLTSQEDDEGYRLLRVYACIDDGETNHAPGIGQQRICTLVQRPNKEDYGDFVHTDWDNAINGIYDDRDLHAEVSLYYHARKIYALILDERVGLVDRLPGRHDAGGEKVPLTLVANYRYPSTGDALMPIAMSFYIPREHMEMGMATFMGIEGIAGDVMLFGQGPKADFAYDGETVYHEFGHMINCSLAGMEYNIYIDDYGMCNMANALEQGLAETYTFLASGKSALFDYIDQVTATGGFARDVDNDDRFPRDMEGIDQFDGLIVAGANWEAFQWLNEQYGFDKYDFARLVMRAEMEMNTGDLDYTFDRYAQSFLDVLAGEDTKGAADDVEAIFEGRGLFETERAKDLAECETLYFGGAYNAPWNDLLHLKKGEETVNVSTAYVQCFFDVSPGETAVTLSASVLPLPDSMGMYPEADDWDLKLFVRSGEAIRYSEVEPGTYEAACDRIVEADHPAKEEFQWILDGFTPDDRIYLHLVNYGDSPGVAINVGFANPTPHTQHPIPCTLLQIRPQPLHHVFEKFFIHLPVRMSIGAG